MSSLINTCEGTNGSALPATNAGAPNPFDTTSISGTGSTKTWSNAHFYDGATSALIHLALGVSASGYCAWSVLPNTPTTNAYARIYLWLSAYPAFSLGTVERVFAFLNGTTLCGALVIPNTGTLRTLTGTGGGTIATMATAIPLNQWVRIEYDLTNINTGASTADVAARMFSGANLEGTTPDSGGSLSNTGVASMTGGTVTALRIGPSAADTLTADWDFTSDAAAYSDTATPGPLFGVLPDVTMAPRLPV